MAALALALALEEQPSQPSQPSPQRPQSPQSLPPALPLALTHSQHRFNNLIQQ